jgi:hypothetical protein
MPPRTTVNDGLTPARAASCPVNHRARHGRGSQEPLIVGKRLAS